MALNTSARDMQLFENPDELPLEDLQIIIHTNGVVVNVNALDKSWADDRYFLHYEAPKIHDQDGKEILGAKNYWMEIVHYIINDLKWLLGLPYYRFWSNIVFNSSILDTLVSFLQAAPPFYALENFSADPEMLELLEILRCNVLIVFTRLVTNKESSKEYMTREFLGSVLYDKYIFTVPIIFDLCQLYGRENGKIMENILKSLFTLKPLYRDDLEKAVPCLVQALENVEIKFQDCPDTSTGEAVSLSKRVDGSLNMTLFQLEDMILYILDISSTITTLFRNYPPVVSIFHREDFTNKIVTIYEKTIPEMYKKLDTLGKTNENLPKYVEIKFRLDVTRIELINLFRVILYQPILSILENTDAMSEAEIKERVDDYINLLSNAIAEREFIADYDQYHPVDNDLKTISSFCPEVDAMKCDYILKSIYATIGKPDVSAFNLSNDMAESIAGPSGKPTNKSNAAIPNNFLTGNHRPIMRKSAELATLVTEVKDLLSDADETLIERCLTYYNYNAEAVINAMLEDTLPSQLKEIESTRCYVPPELLNPSTSSDSLTCPMKRLNILDNGEVVVVPRKTIEVAKEYITRNYSLVDEYDDEHDDTYDSRDVRGIAQESMEIDYRPFTVPRVLAEKQKVEISYDDESDTEDDDETEPNNKDHFIPNPEEVRAKAEQRRKSMRGGKSSSNVVGKPRGQGQDQATLNNRHHKTVNKAVQANHNRSSGASHKRRQGMIPL